MSETSQAKLLEDADELQALLKRVGKARDVMRGIEAERATAGGRLAKLRDERTALQLKLATLEGDSKTIETQIVKLDEAIVGLRALLQSVYDGGLVQDAPRVMSGGKVSGRPSAPAAADNVRAGVLAACLAGPKATYDLYPLFPKANEHTVQSAVSSLVSQGKLGRTKIEGERGFMYGPPGRMKATVNGARSPIVAAPLGDAERRRIEIVEACAHAPMTMPELRVKFPNIAVENLRPIVSLMVQSGRLKRTGTLGKYVYAAGDASAASSSKPKPNGTPVARPGGSNDDNVRSYVLAACLSEPKSPRQLRLLLPKVNERTVRSALSALLVQGRLSRIKVKGQRGGTYGAPAALTKLPAETPAEKSPSEKSSPTPRGAHIERVLATCKTPMTFAALASRLSSINPHVLAQSVYALTRTKRLLRSGKRGMYVYKTA